MALKWVLNSITDSNSSLLRVIIRLICLQSSIQHYRVLSLINLYLWGCAGVFMDWFISFLVAGGAIALLIGYFFYQRQIREKHEKACFDAMLRMLLQPTSANIATLETLLKQRYLSDKIRHKLLYEAELEADCLSIMPTGEIRSSQPFLKQRYNQILASSSTHIAVNKLVKTRLTNFQKA